MVDLLVAENTDDPAVLAELVGVRLGSLGWGAGPVEGLERLSGGASRQTWSFRAIDPTGRRVRLILRRDPPSEPRPQKMALEARAIQLAGTHGVPVPELVDSSSDASVLGSPYLLMSHVDGETIARRILREPQYADARAGLAHELGSALGRIHRIGADGEADLTGFERIDPLARHRQRYVEFGFHRPVIELALRWLRETQPTTSARPALVHGDFRMGNIIVAETGLAAVLDWENVHLGDPMEDLGYLCIRSWRFAGPGPVAGVGTFEQLFDGYESAAGVRPDPFVVRWWQVLGTLQWALGCMVQVSRHLTGTTRSVELAAIGRRIAEQEHDLLRLIGSDIAGRAS